MSDYDYEDDEEPDLSEIHDRVAGPRTSSEFGPVPIDDVDPDQQLVVGDNAVQFMLLSYLSSSQPLWMKCAHILDPDYFDAEFRPVVKLLRDYEHKNHTMPSKLVIRADTGIELEHPEDVDHPLVTEDIAIRVEEFCRMSAAEKVLSDGYEAIHTKRDRGTMMNILKQMEWASSISVQQDLGYEVHDSVQHLLEIAEKSDGLPTGFDFLDAALNGGVTRPSFNLVSAASGQGKSIYLMNQAINYARQGHNVVYISLELPEFMVEKRFAAMMTAIGINEIYQNLDTVITRMKRAKLREGKIQIKRMPMTGVTVADIRAFVNELIASTGEEWNHIMIDYLDLMSPMAQGIREDNIHLRDKAVANETYEWTHDPLANKVIWSASQQTKGAKDERDARQSAVAGGVGKVFNCDNLLILKRSREDIQDERVWCFVEKGRNGGQGLRIPFHWHADTQRMSNPEEFEDLFAEANAPGGGEEQDDSKKKKPRFANDPLARAAAVGNSAASKAAQATKDKIMANRFKRDK